MSLTDPLVTKERSTEPRRNAVLVVEDDFLARWGVSEYLRETGFNVIEAVNASEALAAIHADSAIDAIFWAIGITTGVGGEEFLGLVARERPSLPVLIAWDGSDQDSTLANTPTRAKIGKPYLMIDVEQRLRDLIAAG
jgi:DNA-binding NtrC family response regulator